MQEPQGESLTGRLSTLRCPVCRAEQTATMPDKACVYFYECIMCHTMFKPKPGDCCVFCSYGTVPCPPKQVEGGKSAGTCC